MIDHLHIKPFTEKRVWEYLRDILAVAEDVPGEYWEREHFLSQRPEKFQLSFVVCNENHPIAYSVMSRKSPEQVYIHHFMVARSYRNRGLGSQMIKEAVERAKKAGATEIALKAPSPDAQRFYRRHGFVETGDCYLLVW